VTRQTGGARTIRIIDDDGAFLCSFYRGKLGFFSANGERVGEWFSAHPKDDWAPYGFAAGTRQVAFAASPGLVRVHDLEPRREVSHWSSAVGTIKGLAMSPDGRYTLVLGPDECALQRTESGEKVWSRPSAPVMPVFHPDGDEVAVFRFDGNRFEIERFETDTGKLLGTLRVAAVQKRPLSYICGFQLSYQPATSQMHLFGNGRLITWNYRNAVCQRNLFLPPTPAMALHPEGGLVALAMNTRIGLYETARGELVRTLSGATAPVERLAFSDDGRRLWAYEESSSDAAFHEWLNVAGGEAFQQRRYIGKMRGLNFGLRSTNFLVCGALEIEEFSVPDFRSVWQRKLSGERFQDLVLRPPRGESVWMKYPGTSIISPGTRKGYDRALYVGKDVNMCGRPDFSEDGRRLLLVKSAHTPVDPGTGLLVVDLEAGKEILNRNYRGTNRALARFFLNDEAIITGGARTGLIAVDLESGKDRYRVEPKVAGSVSCLAASADGRHFVTGGKDRWIRVWNAADGRPLREFRGHWESVASIDLSADGRIILSGGADGVVRLHDTDSGALRKSFFGHVEPVVAVAISPDQRWLAATDVKGSIKVWEFPITSPDGGTTSDQRIRH